MTVDLSKYFRPSCCTREATPTKVNGLTYDEWQLSLARIEPGVKPKPGPANYWQLYPWERPKNVIPPARPRVVHMGLPKWMGGANDTDSKQCARCKNFYLRKCAFHKDKHQPDGLRAICSNCMSAATSRIYSENRDAKRAKARERAARPEAKVKRRAYLERTRERTNQWSKEYAIRHPEMTKASQQKWKAKQSEEYRKKRNEQRREYDRKHPLQRKLGIARYRAKLKAQRIQSITAAQLQARIDAFGDVCAYCGGEWSHLDHVKPISRGGPHCLANLRPACAGCNHRKSSKDWRVWFETVRQGNHK